MCIQGLLKKHESKKLRQEIIDLTNYCNEVNESSMSRDEFLKAFNTITEKAKILISKYLDDVKRH